MGMKQAKYADVRRKMKPGDVIAFSGKGHFSEIIKWATWSQVSHVGVVLQTHLVDDVTGRFFNQIIESTSLNGFNGVNISRLSDRIDHYDGDLWWLPLSEPMSKSAGKLFYDFLFNQAKARKEYDMPQAIGSAVDALDQLPFGLHGPGYNREDFSKFFCSELVAAGLEKAGVVNTVNASEVTPIDLCRWNIYEDNYYHIKVDEEPKKISRYNTLDPAQWNV